MRVYCSNDGMYVFECKYEEREIAKLIKFKWNKKLTRWEKKPSVMLLKILEQRKGRLNFTLDRSVYIFNKEPYKVTWENKTKSTPMWHQNNMADLVFNNKRVILDCGVGTGKSLVGLLASSYVGGKTIIICPASTVPKWGLEISKHTNLTYCLLTGTLDKRKKLIKTVEADIYVINIEMANKLEAELIAIKPKIVVVDEVHRTKSRKASQSKSVHKIAKQAEYCVGMSGTVLGNSYVDFFMQFKVVNESLFGDDYYLFEDRYIVKGGYGNHIITGYRNEEELFEIMKPYIITYTLDDVAPYLPKEVEDIIPVELPSSIEKLIKKMAKDRIIEVDGKEIIAEMPVTRDEKINQMCSGFIYDENKATSILDSFKLDVLFDYIDRIEGQVVVWCKHTEVIKLIQSRAEKEGIKYDTYYGEHHGDYLTFEKSDKKLWISQISTGIGYDLPTVQYSIFFQIDYSRINQVQAKGRTRRLVGSENGSRFYIYLLTKYEQHIYDVLKDKDYDDSEKNRLLEKIEKGE